MLLNFRGLWGELPTWSPPYMWGGPLPFPRARGWDEPSTMDSKTGLLDWTSGLLEWTFGLPRLDFWDLLASLERVLTQFWNQNLIKIQLLEENRVFLQYAENTAPVQQNRVSAPSENVENRENS